MATVVVNELKPKTRAPAVTNGSRVPGTVDYHIVFAQYDV